MAGFEYRSGGRRVAADQFWDIRRTGNSSAQRAHGV
jgi:hypothetical protein